MGPSPLAHNWYTTPALIAHSSATHCAPVTQAIPLPGPLRNIDGASAAAIETDKPHEDHALGRPAISQPMESNARLFQDRIAAYQFGWR